MPDFNRSSNGAQNPEVSSSFSPSYQICPYFPKLKPLKSRPKNDPTPFLHRRPRGTTVQWPQISTMLFTASSSFECLHLIFDQNSYSSGTLPYPRVQIPIPGDFGIYSVYIHLPHSPLPSAYLIDRRTLLFEVPKFPSMNPRS
ncbi:putative Reticuline oxidase precursor [Corchorus olitorius]|uniref:Reticuline oxidase n=1 Tax=Corchorus olitorius TaxID=93759 RepID=A0A1R3G6S2_9ROSI|nr:putative Reticuline oxidase precursor [Corchorus olitorius]